MKHKGIYGWFPTTESIESITSTNIYTSSDWREGNGERN